MPTWKPEDLRNYENRTRRTSPSPVTEPTVQNDPLGQECRKEKDAAGIHVCIVSYRQKLLDPDNLTVKYFVDSLRYSGIIPDDRQEDIHLTVSQKKVAHKVDEKTEITLDL